MRNRNEHAAVRRNTDLNTLRLTKKTQVKRKGGKSKKTKTGSVTQNRTLEAKTYKIKQETETQNRDST